MATEQLPTLLPVTKHAIVGFFMTLGIGVAWYIYATTSPFDEWSRRWLLVVVPFLSGQGLLFGWHRAWRTVLLWIAAIYLFTPFIAARVESCTTVIPGAVPCFADVVILREVTSQTGHHVYFLTLIAVHTIGMLALWVLVARQGAVDASARPSTD